jgi:hypothetical protein
MLAEDRVLAMRHRTDDDHRSQLLLPPGALPSEVLPVWHRDGRAEDVLAELLELPAP